MSNLHLLKLAWRNCLRMWRYTLSAFIILAVGLISLFLFRGYLAGTDEMWDTIFRARTMLGDVQIETLESEGKTGWAAMISDDAQAKLATVLEKYEDRIETKARFIQVQGEAALNSETAAFIGLAFDREGGKILRGKKWEWDALAGEPLNAPRDVVMGSPLAELLGCDIPTTAFVNLRAGEPGYVAENRPFRCNGEDGSKAKVMLRVSTESGQTNATYLNFKGSVNAGFPELDRMWVMLNLEDAQKLLDTKKISRLSIQLRPGFSAREFVKELQPELAGLGLRAMTWQVHRVSELYRRVTAVFVVHELFAVSILHGLIMLSIFNLMLKIIDERTREIGLLQALGYRAGTIRKLFIYEASISSLAGLAAGSVVAVGIGLLLNHLGILYDGGFLSEPIPFYVSLSPRIWLWTSGTLFGVAVASAFAAILRALKKTVVECLVH